VFVFLRGKPAPPPVPRLALSSADLLAMVPRNAALELSCDFERLRKSELGALANEQLNRLGGGGDLAKRCGFDPLALIDRVALGIPTAQDPPGGAGDFALLAAGHFKGDAIVGCGEQLIRDRGGEPTRSSLGALASVRDRNGGSGEVAARDNGPLIVSGGAYFREVADLANEPPHAGSLAARNPEHAALRKALGDGTILVSWLVPDGWFGRVADDERAKVSALAAVHAVAARVDLASNVRVTVLLSANDEPAAETVSTLLSRLKQSAASLLPDPMLAGLAGRVVLGRERGMVTLKLELTMSEAQALLTRVGTLLAGGTAPN
jgi:hypothetical protein